MPDNYFVNVRRAAKLDLLKFLKSNPDMDIKQAAAVFSLQTGLKVTTIERYYQELKDAKAIE